MKTLKSLFAFILSVPLLYMPIELALSNKSSNADVLAEETEFTTATFGTAEWMTSNLANVTELTADELLTYEEVESLKPEGWNLPTSSDMKALLSNMGFEAAPGVIPSSYYDFNWEYDGYVDPIIGESSMGEKMFLWLKDDGAHNYVVIDKDQLSYRMGKTLASSQLSARLIRK